MDYSHTFICVHTYNFYTNIRNTANTWVCERSVMYVEHMQNKFMKKKLILMLTYANIYISFSDSSWPGGWEYITH